MFQNLSDPFGDEARTRATIDKPWILIFRVAHLILSIAALASGLIESFDFNPAISILTSIILLLCLSIPTTIQPWGVLWVAMCGALGAYSGWEWPEALALLVFFIPPIALLTAIIAALHQTSNRF